MLLKISATLQVVVDMTVRPGTIQITAYEVFQQHSMWNKEISCKAIVELSVEARRVVDALCHR